MPPEKICNLWMSSLHRELVWCFTLVIQYMYVRATFKKQLHNLEVSMFG